MERWTKAFNSYKFWHGDFSAAGQLGGGCHTRSPPQCTQYATPATRATVGIALAPAELAIVAERPVGTRLGSRQRLGRGELGRTGIAAAYTCLEAAQATCE